jgi:diguanylate cyclase (GGDEF)-like protein/PAS domain S-box-containing protein
MTAVVMVTSVAALLLACIAFLGYDHVAFRRTMVQELLVLAQVIADRSTASVAFDDPPSGEETLAALHAHRSVVAAYIFDKDGKVFASYHRHGVRQVPPPAPTGDGWDFLRDSFEVRRRIVVAGSPIGSLLIRSDLDDLTARFTRFTWIVGLVLVFCSLTTFFLSQRLQGLVTGPVLALARTADRVSRERDFALRATKQADDEVGRLIDAFNDMLDHVQARDEALLKAKETAEAAAAATLESEQRFRQLAETIESVFWMVEAGTRKLIYVSPAYETIFRRSCASLYADPRSYIEVVHPDDRPRMIEMFERETVKRLDGLDEEYRLLLDDGTLRWIRTRVFAVRDNDGRATRFVGISSDVTDRKLAEEAIRHRAYHDELTGLPNRLLFADRFAQTLDHVRRTGKTVALLFLDLDRFKTINDTLGHATGDRLLQDVTERLCQSLRGGDTVARFGGDEFIVLASGIEKGEDAAYIAEKLLQLLQPPFKLAPHELSITTSIGIALYPDDGTDIETLVKNADTALYRAKERGRNCYQLYSPAMNARALEQLALENELRGALERNEFLLHYQPEFELRTGRVVGVEALIRWQRPGREMMLPQQFISLAEDAGLIDALGEWVLRTACEQTQRWRAAGLEPMRVAVNLSPRQFEQKDVARSIEGVLALVGLDPSLLELELTEGTVMRNAEAAALTLHALKAMNVRIVIDDFGTGYSSLSYLKRFPASALKIDQSFVRDIVTDPEDAAIVRAVVSLGHSLGLEVIAEGVETAAQLEFLRGLGCDYAQGYYLGRPMPPDVLERRLRQASFEPQG